MILMTIQYIIKKNGRIEKFEKTKVENGLFKAVKEAGGNNKEKSDSIAAKVIDVLEEKAKGTNQIKWSEVLDEIENTLIKGGHDKTARAFILYRYRDSMLRKSEDTDKDNILMKHYLDKSDWTVKENANMGYSLQGLNLNMSSKITQNYWLSEIYPSNIAKEHIDSNFHIHDLSVLGPYCMGHDLLQLITTGFNGVPGKIYCSPPKHLRSALGQAVNYTYTLSGECYDEETEILSDNGWKYFKDLLPNDTICTLNLTTKEIQYQQPLRYINKWYEGEMIKFKNIKFDLLVTPKHRMIYTHPNVKKVKFCEAKKFNSNMGFIPKGGNWIGTSPEYFYLPSITIQENMIGKNNTRQIIEKIIPEKVIPIIVWLKFLGMYLSEGCVNERHGIDHRRNKPRQEYAVGITQKKFKKEFEDVLNELGYKYSTCHRKDGLNDYRISNKQLFLYLKQFGISKDKYLPEFIKNLSPKLLTIFYDYMMLGDGTSDLSKGNECYYTASYKLAGDIQDIILKMGFNSNILTHKRDKYIWYVVSKQKTPFYKISKENITTQKYKGNVYCVEVPNSTLYVRRNGKATWCGNCAGAQAFSNFDTLLAPYIKKDNLSREDVKQALQEYLYNMNVPTRVGFQSVFSNITLDVTCPNKLKNTPAFIGNEMADFTYGDCQNEMNMFNEIFCELMCKGDGQGRLFSFPIPTYNITKEFDWENPINTKIFEMTSKFGIPYFSNFINSDMSVDDATSMCCRLRLNTKELSHRGGGLFGASPKTGSVGVVTINMPRIGYETKTEEAYFKRLDQLMDLAKDSLIIKTNYIEKMTEEGLYPYLKHYLAGVKADTGRYWSNHFLTIGLLGLNESLINFNKPPISTEEGAKFAEKVLQHMRDRIIQYQHDTGFLLNLEASPAEGVVRRFAYADKEKYPNIIVANEEKYKNNHAAPYYTNSSQISVDANIDLFTQLKLQNNIQSLYTGGVVFHIYAGEKAPSPEAVKTLIRRSCENYKIPYFSFTPTFSICPVHSYLAGEHKLCPTCLAEGEK